MFLIRSALALAACAALAAAAQAQATPGVTASTVVIGQSAPLSGANAELADKTLRRLARLEDIEPDAELREDHLAQKARERPEARPMPPARVARVEDEPALAGRHEAVLGLLELGFGDHRRRLR